MSTPGSIAPLQDSPPTPPLPQQIDHVTREQLRRLAAAETTASRGITFLELWNGGGLVALLSYWSAVPEVRELLSSTISLVGFFLGFLFIAATVVLDYELTRRDYDRFNDNSGDYFKRKLSWAELWDVDRRSLSRCRILPALFGYLSVISALAATVFGALAVLTR